MNYKALLQERADLVKEANAIFELAEKEGRGLTEEEQARDDTIHARLDELNADIARLERHREHARQVAALQDANIAAQQRSVISGMRERIEDDPRGGFATLAEFALAVRQASTPGGAVDERLRYLAAPDSNYHRETGSGEGRMVPAAFRQEIFEVVTDAEESLLALVDSEPTSGNSVEFLRDESTPWGSTGVSASWRAEGAQMTPSRLVTEASQMKLHELYAFVTATQELLQDAPRLSERLTRRAGIAIRWKVNQAIVSGSGAAQPLGWMNAGSLVTVTKESGQAAATVLPANVAKMYSRLRRPDRGIWFINQDVLPQLLTMTLGDQPIWTPPATGFTNAPGGFLFGRPVRFLEHCESLGTRGDIQFVDPLGYYAITRGNTPEFASSIHLYFDYGLEAFRWTFRMNGQPFLESAVSPAKGSNTRSDFVVLATRA